ncbi:MAG: CehA/McbA family metallohydrolase [Deltaproteobacteria bacterium]|nr:CehA/McbA family metallohydrolase [Deltaproteobacteria bacterium]
MKARRRTFALLLTVGAALGLLAAARGQRRPSPRPRMSPLARGPLPARALAPGEVQVGRYLSSQGLPLGPRTRGRPGDYFLRSSALVAVVRAEDGALVDLAPGPAFVDRIGWAQFRVCDSRGTHPIAVERYTLVREGRTELLLEGAVHGGPRLEVQLRFRLDGAQGILELETRLFNRGGTPRFDVELCDHLGLTNTPLQLPGLGELRPGGQFPRRAKARFAARTEGTEAFVLAQQGFAPLELAVDPAHPAGAFDPAIDVRYGKASLPPGGSLVRTRWLVAQTGALHEALATALRRAGRPTSSFQLDARALPEDGRVLVRRGGRPFLATRVRGRARVELPQDGASYVASALLPGAAEGSTVALSASREVRLKVPRRGALALRVVDERGEPLPAKVRLEGLGGTPDPDFGNAGGLTAGASIYSLGAREVRLAPGRYRATASRGPEYGVAQLAVQVRADGTTPLRLALRKLVPTPGWIAADLHVHSAASFDSPDGLDERLVSAAAVGLELLVATDHNTVTDYARLPDRARTAPWVQAVPGQEVTTEGYLFGHFNIWPLPDGRPLEWVHTRPAQLFAEARRRGPSVLVQVNHPRMGSIGYFDQLGLDPTTGRATSPEYRADFELLEVFNGDDLDQPAALERVVSDWFALLNLGRRYVATAGSDAHRLPVQDPGTPRTFIHWQLDAREDDDAVRARPAQVASALKAGRATLTSGPVVHFSVGGKPLGALVPLPKGGVPALVEIYAPPQQELQRAELVANGRIEQRFAMAAGRSLRLRQRLVLRPAKDTWYVLRVAGASADPTQRPRPVRPFALTNPIWVDADGDGRFTPPGS